MQLAKTVEKLGAGEILLNCMDQDGRNSGYDLELIKMVKSVTSIPIIASSGAGKLQHFEQVFTETNCDAALAAGIFHREEVEILQVKVHLNQCKFQVRL